MKFRTQSSDLSGSLGYGIINGLINTSYIHGTQMSLGTKLGEDTQICKQRVIHKGEVVRLKINQNVRLRLMRLSLL